MTTIKTIADIEADNYSFGNKARYLAMLMREGFNVPCGIAFKDGYDIEDIIAALAAINLDDKALAVRSSAGNEDNFDESGAGRYQSFLHAESDLEKIIDLTFRSMTDGFTSAAHGIIIQHMISADFGGVCFSTSAHNQNHIAIEFCLETNVGVTQGSKAVARVEIDKQSHTIVALEDPHGLMVSIETTLLMELALCASILERRWGFAVDIEWCVAEGRIFYLQARPITALNNDLLVETIKRETLEMLYEEGNNQNRIYTDASVGDMFRNPSPLLMDLLNSDVGPNWSVRRVFKDLGFKPAAKLQRPLFQAICNRAYIGVTNYMDFVFPNSSGQTFLKANGTIGIRFRATQLLRLIFVVPWKFFKIRNRCQNLKSPPPPFSKGENLEALYEHFKSIRLELAEHVIYPHLMSDIIAGATHMLATLWLKLLFGKEAKTWEQKLCAALPNNFNTESSLALHDLAHKKISLTDFMLQFGHRGFPDWDLAAPRWRELPDTLLRMAHASAQSGVNMQQRFEEQKAMREEAETALKNFLNQRWWRRLISSFVLNEIQQLQRYSPLREQTQSVIYQWIESLRLVTLEMGKKTGLDELIFYLHESEIAEVVMDSAQVSTLKKIAALRKRKQQLSQRIHVPHCFESTSLSENLFKQPVHTPGTNKILGTSASQGIVRGQAKIVNNLDEIIDIQPHEIIVTKYADPSYASLLLASGGLILEQGSVYSHSAIVAREFGLPVLVNASRATQEIQQGQWIVLDATRGWVEL